MASFSNNEMADIHLIYGMANCNRAEARRIYGERFPNRRLPSENYFVLLDRRLRETGNFCPNLHDRGRPRSTRTLDLEEQVMHHVDEHPETSTRRISVREGVDHVTVWRILRTQLLYPYHVQRVQALNEDDHLPRRTFCEMILMKLAIDPHFVSKIMFTDEAGFNRDGVINFHNTHCWADENPHVIIQSRFQRSFSLNVWACIIGDSLIGPCFLPNRLNGENYLHFVETFLINYLEEIPLINRNRLWYMHDGAPPHFSTRVRQFLDSHFPERWIGRGGSVHWPARSPDLNPIDFYLWGHIKSIVYSTPVDSVEELQCRIEDAFEFVRATPGTLERVRGSFTHRLRQCVAINGGHIEHLI